MSERNNIDMEYMLRKAKENANLETIDLENFKTEDIKDMDYMFFGSKSLKELNLSKFNTTNVISMVNMFGGCKLLKRLDVSMFNTENVISMTEMFAGCYSLEELDLSGFDTSKVIEMTGMFSGCESLKRLNLSSFNISGVKHMEYMFDRCNSLKTVVLGPMCLGLKEMLPANVEVIVDEDSNVEALSIDDMFKEEIYDELYNRCPSVYKKNHTRQECIDYMKQFEI